MKRLPDRQILMALFMAALLPFLLVELFPSPLYHVIEIKDYLLFHNIAEFFSVMVSLSIFGVGWFTYDHTRDRRTLFLSAAFLAIGLMDFMHTLGYAGMPPFITPNSANKSTQYWIAVRSLAAAAFLGSAFIYPERPHRWLSKPILLTLAIAIPLAVFTGVTFLPARMPATFIEGVGLTPFKKIAEGVIILILILALAAYWRRMAKTGERLLLYYLSAFILCICSELVFAVYRSAFDTYNLLGHLYKVAAFCLIYRGIFVASVSSPFLRLSDLNEKLRLEIGEREKTDAELRRSEGRYRSLTLATSQIVWTTNAAGEVEEDIPLWRSFTGQGEDDVKGRGWMEALHPDDRERTERVWAHALETRSPYDTEYRIRRSDGEYRHFSVRGAPVPGDEDEIREWVGTCSDITDRKMAEELIIKGKEEWERTFDAITDPIMVIGVDYRIVKVNRAMAAKLGKAPGDAVGLLCFEAVHGCKEPPSFCPHAMSLADGLPHSVELHEKRMGGDFLVAVSPLLSAYGELKGSVHYAREITAIKEAQKSLHDERKRFRDVLDRLPAYLVLLTPDYGVPFANRFFEERFGTAGGRRCYEYLFNRTEPCESCETYTVLKTNAPHRWEWRGPDGCDYDIHDLPFTDADGSPLIMEVGFDVTEKKRAEARLDRQFIVLNAINRVFHDAYSCDTLDLLGKKCLHIAEGLTQSRFGFILEINRQGRMDAIAMSDPGWIECRIEESEAVRMLKDMEIRGIWGEAVKRGVSVVVNDPAVHPDRVGTPAGHPPITCFLGVPLEQAGKVIGLIGLANKGNGYDDEDRECIEALASVFVEALMRKRAEVEIKSLNEELEERVTERTSQLEAANRELEAFAYSVSHDLRAPLRAIDGFSQALIEDCRERLDESGHDYLRRVREASQRMGTLIDDILRLTRVSREELSKVPVDLSRLARAVAAELSYREPERDVEFVIDEGLETRGDPRLLKMALENLLGNAWKFTGRHPAARIEFRSGERDGRPVYIVRDNGAGFDMAYAEKLFTPFQRLHSQDEFTGSGIGLSLVQRIIHRHGGMVWAEGGVERGATFYFTIAT